MPNKIVIINGHPDPSGNRLCDAIAKAYASGAETRGHEVRVIAVSQIDFPLLRTKEGFESDTPPPAIKVAQETILWADHMVIIYPLWLGALPALLKAFIEQCFRPGFAFEANSQGWPKQYLKGRSARIIVTMGMPAFVYRWYFGAHTLKNLKRNILQFCGVKPVRSTILGLVEAADEQKRQRWLTNIERLGRDAV